MTMKPAMAQSRPAMPSQVQGRSSQAGRVPASLRCSLILTPHAHRKKAPVGASTSTSTRKMTRSMVLSGASLHRSQNKLQVLQHTGGRAPDVAAPIGHGVEGPPAALGRDAAVQPVVPFVEEVIQRHLEYVGYLPRVCTRGESRANDPNHRYDFVARASTVRINCADDLDEFSRQPNLLFGFAQRGRHGIGIAVLYAAAGKSDLPGMTWHIFRALGQ